MKKHEQSTKKETRQRGSGVNERRQPATPVGRQTENIEAKRPPTAPSDIKRRPRATNQETMKMKKVQH